jgi:folate-binding protein YgfZ
LPTKSLVLARDVLIGLICAAMAVAVRLLIENFWQGVILFPLVFPAVVASTLLSNWRAGLVTIAVCQTIIWYFMMPVKNSFVLPNTSAAVSLILATVAELLLLVMVHKFQVSRRRIIELDALRIAAGVPAVPVDCGAHEFPQECGVEAWVSYTKGCYLGQEVMARIQSMGSLRRILRRVAGPVSVGQELKTPEGKAVGTVRSAAGDVGLALVSVDLPEGAVFGELRIGAPTQMAVR